ncbi:phospholipase A1 member A-like [Schistocerca gregaria]|uniref:phospholipase A1 member A-like n=1 Tax=Schistocerca gregaria TaxID=7010 RepID=UPI00211EA1F1|nr:phospholipase A1 member A-like [Schistocerca gregaria]
MGALEQALLLGLNSTDEFSFRDCVWRRGSDRDACPDPDVHLYLYTSANASRVEVPQSRSALARGEWLREAAGNGGGGGLGGRQLMLLVHGYAGGDGLLPAVVLRDAYLRSGRFWVLVADWGALGRPPCYPAAVHNLRTAASCLARQLSALRQLGGLAPAACVGHSLGAHLCGLLARQLRFRLPTIIGLDPARPLVRAALRLAQGDAGHVQTLHTNAGHYGELATPRMAHVSVCVNGGRLQPFCLDKTDPHLCSHVRSVCLLAETLQAEGARRAAPCGRRCVAPASATASASGAAPAGRSAHRPGSFLAATRPGGLLFGHLAPPSASGSFCVSTPEGEEPFCPRFEGDAGDRRCCSRTQALPPAPAAPSAPPPEADRGSQELHGTAAPLLAWQLATAEPARLQPATVSQGYAAVKG